MEPRISLITLGVTDLSRTRRFYQEGLGWPLSGVSGEDVAFFRTAGTVLALYPRHLLAEDANLPAEGSGFGGFALAHNVRERGEVDDILAQAEAAGARILKPAQEAFWGGYHGYFADPDGFTWEVAWNPGFPIEADGSLRLPE